MYTPDNINRLKPNEVFVFGSNQMAAHGGGAAAFARINFLLHSGFGAIGLYGQCYGIITTSVNNQPIELSFIGQQLIVLYGFAKLRPELTFLVTKIGTGIAGFDIKEIAGLFRKIEHIRPANILLPKEFTI